MPRSSDPFNRLYEGMLPFHENFRRSYAYIQQVLPVSQSLSKRDLETFLARSDQLVHHLEMHHHIEVSQNLDTASKFASQIVLTCSLFFGTQETYIFPLLAKRMPAFAHGDSHRKEHETMHHQLELFQQYVKKVAQALNSSQGKRAISEGAGQPRKNADDEGSSGRKEWPREVYDADKMKALVDTLGEALFPHLKAEEESLKAKSMRAAGWTEAEIAQIPM